MAFDSEKLTQIFERTDGRCHLCRKKLARKNYGVQGARGAWEVEHSKPRSKGGTDHRNNLYPACIHCNRSKGNATTRSARIKHGHRAAPYSRSQKTRNACATGIAGAVIGAMIFGPAGAVAGALIGAECGKSSERD